MTESILTTIKALLGIPPTDPAFDTDIIVHINSAFMTLKQLGVGPATTFSIEDSTPVWADFITDIETYSAVKSYIYLKVKLAFDPPGTSYHLESVKEQIAELSWRLMTEVPIPVDPVVPEEI